MGPSIADAPMQELLVYVLRPVDHHPPWHSHKDFVAPVVVAELERIEVEDWDTLLTALGQLV